MAISAKWMAPAAVAFSLNVCSFSQGEPAAEHAPAALAQAEAPVTPAPAPAARPVRLRHGVFKYSSYPAAWTSAQASNKPILVFATSTNCPHCVRMVGESFQAPQVGRFVNDSFETVYVSRNEQPEMAAKLRIRFFPTTIVVGPNNQVLDVIEGYVDANTLAQRLQSSMAMHRATQQR
jgi:thiol-disulfide isomerase/thioredoxin